MYSGDNVHLPAKLRLVCPCSVYRFTAHRYSDIMAMHLVTQLRYE